MLVVLPHTHSHPHGVIGVATQNEGQNVCHSNQPSAIFEAPSIGYAPPYIPCLIERQSRIV